MDPSTQKSTRNVKPRRHAAGGRRDYVRPTLRAYGHVRRLTTGGTGMNPEMGDPTKLKKYP